MKTRDIGTKRIALAVAVLAATVAGAPRAHAGKAKTTLDPTVNAPTAKGTATVSTHNAKGKFVVTGKHLTPNKTFHIVVGGVPIGTMTTSSGGSGKARFATNARGTTQPLGVDPGGKSVAVNEDDQGEDELVGDMGEDEPGNGACCLPDDDGTECEDLAATDCTNAGGQPSTAASCIPNPCGNSAGGAFIACCEDNNQDSEGEAECELMTATACADEGGIVTAATSCSPNPCVSSVGQTTRCCVSEDSDESGDAQGGDTGSECEQLTPQHCVDAGGKDIGAGSCEGDPCPSPSGAFLDPIAAPF
jgi:hypothetical protein